MSSADEPQWLFDLRNTLQGDDWLLKSEIFGMTLDALLQRTEDTSEEDYNVRISMVASHFMEVLAEKRAEQEDLNRGVVDRLVQRTLRALHLDVDNLEEGEDDHHDDDDEVESTEPADGDGDDDGDGQGADGGDDDGDDDGDDSLIKEVKDLVKKKKSPAKAATARPDRGKSGKALVKAGSLFGDLVIPKGALNFLAGMSVNSDSMRLSSDSKHTQYTMLVQMRKTFEPAMEEDKTLLKTVDMFIALMIFALSPASLRVVYDEISKVSNQETLRVPKDGATPMAIKEVVTAYNNLQKEENQADLSALLPMIMRFRLGRTFFRANEAIEKEANTLKNDPRASAPLHEWAKTYYRMGPRESASTLLNRAFLCLLDGSDGTDPEYFYKINKTNLEMKKSRLQILKRQTMTLYHIGSNLGGEGFLLLLPSPIQGLLSLMSTQHVEKLCKHIQQKFPVVCQIGRNMTENVWSPILATTNKGGSMNNATTNLKALFLWNPDWNNLTATELTEAHDLSRVVEIQDGDQDMPDAV